MRAEPFDPLLFVLRPTYELDTENQTFREKNVKRLEEELAGTEYSYMGLGYDRVDDLLKNEGGNICKHYRFVLPDRVENIKSLMNRPAFDSIPIQRGKRFSSNSFEENLRQANEEDLTVGQFKASVKVMLTADQELEEELAIEAKLNDTFLNKRKIKVFLYVIDARNLPRKDDDSNSDPYLVVLFGDRKFDFS
jgi:hypothetical protein